MIRVQPTSKGSYRFLIGSDLKDPLAAKNEVESWVAENDCVLPDNARHLIVFEAGIQVREWVLVERKPVIDRVPTPAMGNGGNPLWQMWSNRPLPKVPPAKDNVIVLFPSAA